jgi:DNA-binding Lrp family transcriptional regulator
MGVEHLLNLEPTDLKILRKLAIDPRMRQVDIARDLGVTRSSVNQVWKRLANSHGFRVNSVIDYGQVGMALLFGWAQIPSTSKTLASFRDWLESSVFVSDTTYSLVSSTTYSTVYFEAVLPRGERVWWFTKQLEGLCGAHDDIIMVHDTASEVSHHLNLGLFDGSHWDFDEGFRFQASTGVARGYADVLPVTNTLKQSESGSGSIVDMALLSAVQQDYHASARQVAAGLRRLGSRRLSERTLRRHLEQIRNWWAMPYIELDNIGLAQRVLVCVENNPNEQSLSRVLHVQAGALPKARVVSGPRLSVLDLKLPISSNLVALSSSLERMIRHTAQPIIFIARESMTRKALENLLSYQAKKLRS